MSKKPINLPKLGRDKVKTNSVTEALKNPRSPVKQAVRDNANEMKKIKNENAKSSLKDWNDTIQGHIKNTTPLLSLDKVKLPTVEEVFLVFQEHQNKLGRAFRNNKWGEIPAIEAETKSKLAELGLAIYIDFTPDEEKKIWDEKVKQLAK